MINEDTHYYNMDLIRYVLAISVLINHFNILAGTDFYWPIASHIAVGIFFGLSGFLVYTSYLKRPVFHKYLKSRIKRIFPPYLFIVLICALGFVFLSTLTAIEYFSNTTFWKYLGANLIFLNFLQPELPGVFTNLPISAVNGSLWTLKVEWMLYLSIPIFVWLIRRFKLNTTYTIIAIIILSVIYRIFFEYLFKKSGNEIYHILSYQFSGQMMYFFAGVLFYHLLPTIKKHLLLVFLSSIAVYTLCYIVNMFINSNIILDFISYLLVPASLVSFALVISIYRPLGKWVKHLNNFSYEIYLFHFPIIQVLLTSIPLKSVGGSTVLLLILSILITIIVSYAFSKVHNMLKNSRKPVEKYVENFS